MIVKCKTCLIYSPGGHYYELQKCLKGIKFKKKYEITFSTKVRRDKKIYYISHPRKNILRTCINFFQSFKILLKEKPTIIISTGADVAVPTFLIGKLIFKTKNIFIESIGNMNEPTLSGRICYYFSDLFLIQFKSLKKTYPNAILAKGLIN